MSRIFICRVVCIGVQWMFTNEKELFCSLYVIVGFGVFVLNFNMFIFSRTAGQFQSIIDWNPDEAIFPRRGDDKQIYCTFSSDFMISYIHNVIYGITIWNKNGLSSIPEMYLWQPQACMCYIEGFTDKTVPKSISDT